MKLKGLKERILEMKLKQAHKLKSLRGGVKKKYCFFLTFGQKGGGVSANPKNPYQKKLRWSKKGEGGGSQFFD